jgi:hypothetical protein
MQFFVKDNKIHKYPQPSKCKVKYAREKLLNSMPAGYEKCEDCFGVPR